MRARLGWVNEASGYRRIAFIAAPISNDDMPKLTIRSDSGEKTSHDLVEESMTIGRSPENAICLDDISVSSRHAELTMAGDICHLKDLGSTNGTLVNGEPIAIAVQLRAGDRVRFGKVDAYYECEAAGDAQPLPRLEEVEARPAESSARPVDFANASPFLNRTKEKDRTRTVVFAAAAIALLAFIGSMIAVFFIMQAPAP
jgi:pSer/pThr/pTyr-binding forkhead associated (FHA) protein